MLACSCVLPEKYCHKCSKFREYAHRNNKFVHDYYEPYSLFEIIFNRPPRLTEYPLRVVKGKIMEYSKAKRYLSKDKQVRDKCLEICLMRD